MYGPRRSRRRPGRRVYGGVALFYGLLFLAVIWPVYPIFARIEPRVLGLPLSLAYVVAALVLSFAVLLALYLWEGADEEEARSPWRRADRGSTSRNLG